MSVPKLFPRNHGSLREEFSPEGSDPQDPMFAGRFRSSASDLTHWLHKDVRSPVASTAH